jgi:hypothetical protein
MLISTIIDCFGTIMKDETVRGVLKKRAPDHAHDVDELYIALFNEYVFLFSTVG